MCNSINFNTVPTKNPWDPPGTPPKPTTLYFLCPFGQAETIIEFGLALNQTKICPTESKYGEIDTDSDCDMQGMGTNYTNFITDNFQKQCYGNVSCLFQFDNKYFSQKCLDKLTTR